MSPLADRAGRRLDRRGLSAGQRHYETRRCLLHRGIHPRRGNRS
jgi:hypothetical protein